MSSATRIAKLGFLAGAVVASGAAMAGKPSVTPAQSTLASVPSKVGNNSAPGLSGKRSEGSERSGNSEHSEHSGGSGRGRDHDHPKHPEHPEHPEHPDHPDHPRSPH